MDWKDIPRLLRHCVVAVHAKVGGAGEAGVISALKICRDCLEKNGYLYRSNVGKALLDDIRLTAKGYQRNQEHLREGGAGERKDLSFKKLFQQIQPIIFELDGPGGKKAPEDASPEESQESEKIDLDSKGGR